MKALRTFGLAAIALVLVASCKREAAPAPAEPAAASTAPAGEAHPVDATSVVDLTPAGQAGPLDSKALAGRFGYGESILELRADGTYVQTLQVGGSSISADGTWSAQSDKSLLLDPNSKSAEDARFEAVSNDELRSSDGARTFRRVASQ